MADEVIFMVPGKEPFGRQEFVAANQEMKDVQMQGTSDIQEVKVLGASTRRSPSRASSVAP